jgi:hypothetical protein
MNRDDQEALIAFCGLTLAFVIPVVMVYSMIFSSQIIYGIVVQEKCSQPTKRIEYIFPGVIVGCWLGEEAK